VTYTDSLVDFGPHHYTVSGLNGCGEGSASYEAIGLRSPRTVQVLAPNGGEDWSAFSMDTVRWWSCDVTGKVKLELNRAYPGGAWESLADSTDNDGVEAVYVPDPLSSHCRLRLTAIRDTATDLSDADFSVSAAQGYLALVRPASPTVPVLSWAVGTVECSPGYTESFRLKNLGSEAMVVFQPQEPASAGFSRTTTCGSFFALAPGQMSSCQVTLKFAPSSDQTLRDTLLIQTDAVNGVNGFVRVPLSGTQISTPAAPQVVISVAGQDARLNWPRITQSTGGCPISVTSYLVYYAPTSGGPYYYHGFTSDTTYVHPHVLQFAGGMYYQVVAFTGTLARLSSVPSGATVDEVQRALRP
jgi:hypothetical protein